MFIEINISMVDNRMSYNNNDNRAKIFLMKNLLIEFILFRETIMLLLLNKAATLILKTLSKLIDKMCL
ncbi:hypothetical protein ARADI_0550 [Arsenophonus endosymbiont of Aleurodicus dispersus]|nr:hypothetical protein ARADI_0550 [Arsenophonus endosymbiont of Aleurodicus dispersus]